MKNKSKLTVGILAGSLIYLAYNPGSALCRDNIVIGTLSVRYDHTERSYDDIQAGDAAVAPREENSGDRRDYRVTPGLTLISTSPTDSVELTYEPGLVYDELDGETNVDHALTLIASKNLSQKWQVTLENQYIMSDDPLSTREPITSVTGAQQTERPTVRPVDEGGLTERQGRRRYWTNDFSIGSEYSYAEDSLVGAGYTYDVLRNEESNSGYDEHDRHDLMIRGAHRFNSQWRAEIEPHYIIGNVDSTVTPETPSPVSDDIKQYEIRSRVDYQRQTQDTFFSRYRYLQSDYDNPTEEDSKINAIQAGWEHDFNSHFHMTLSGGPSFIKLGNRSWDTDYNLYGEMVRDFNRGHGTGTLYAEKGYDLDSFSGTDSGLTDFWRLGAMLDYQWSDVFSTNFYASYRDNRRLEEPTNGRLDAPAVINDSFDYHEKFSEFGASLSYEFMRNYTLTTGYRYLQSNSDLVGEDYDEHLLFLELAFAKDLYRF